MCGVDVDGFWRLIERSGREIGSKGAGLVRRR
jgi:hypothetical protein